MVVDLWMQWRVIEIITNYKSNRNTSHQAHNSLISRLIVQARLTRTNFYLIIFLINKSQLGRPLAMAVSHSTAHKFRQSHFILQQCDYLINPHLNSLSCVLLNLSHWNIFIDLIYSILNVKIIKPMEVSRSLYDVRNLYVILSISRWKMLIKYSCVLQNRFKQAWHQI